MNTSRTKPPKRYDFRANAPMKRSGRKHGTYGAGIADESIALLLGTIVGTWTHVEESMTQVFKLLSGVDDNYSARIIFRTIISQDSRIKVMTALLENSPVNHRRSGWYDEAINEFRSCNTKRNKLVHGLWHTHEDGSVHLTEAGDDIILGAEMRVVTGRELATFLGRIQTLRAMILKNWVADFEKEESDKKSSH